MQFSFFCLEISIRMRMYLEIAKLPYKNIQL